jgi:hypothetical protein
MALVPIKTSAGTGYCECICGCYNLANLRDEESGKAYCPSCAKEHLERNAGVGLPRPAPSHTPEPAATVGGPQVPPPADPPGRLANRS